MGVALGINGAPALYGCPQGCCIMGRYLPKVDKNKVAYHGSKTVYIGHWRRVKPARRTLEYLFCIAY